MGKYNLKVSAKDGQLCFAVDGRLDPISAKEFGDIVTAERKKRPNGSIVFDCKGLEYISSAGLRVFLSLRKKEKEPVKLINVSSAVFEILEVTGFSQLLDVVKGMRDFTNENVQRMGSNGNITVYRVGDDTIMKVYSGDVTIEDIERERSYAQAAFLSGVPTLISYDVVTYNGQYGMLYELAKVSTVSSLLELAPMKLDQYAAELGKLLKTIHTSEPEEGILPRTVDIFNDWAGKMAPWLHSSEISTLRRMINAIPEGKTVVYGNFTPRSVFVQRNEFMLINMGGISCGNPIFDLGTTYMNLMNEHEAFVESATGLTALQGKKCWRAIALQYFGMDENVVKKYDEVIRAAALLRSAIAPAVTNMSKENAERFVADARRDLFPASDYLTTLLSEVRFDAQAQAPAKTPAAAS